MVAMNLYAKLTFILGQTTVIGQFVRFGVTEEECFDEQRQCMNEQLGCIQLAYSGTISKTRSGIPCMYWNGTGGPHTIYHSGDILRENYCRNPPLPNENGPWCYTTDPKVTYEECFASCSEITPIPTTKSTGAARIDQISEYTTEETAVDAGAGAKDDTKQSTTVAEPTAGNDAPESIIEMVEAARHEAATTPTAKTTTAEARAGIILKDEGISPVANDNLPEATTEAAERERAEIAPVPATEVSEGDRGDPNSLHVSTIVEDGAHKTASTAAVDAANIATDFTSQSTTRIEQTAENDVQGPAAAMSDKVVRKRAPASTTSVTEVAASTLTSKAEKPTNEASISAALKDEATTTTYDNAVGSAAEAVEGKRAEITPVPTARTTESDGRDRTAAYAKKTTEAKAHTTPSALAVKTAAIGNDDVSQQITGAQPVEANDAPPSTVEADEVTIHKTAPAFTDSVTGVATTTLEPKVGTEPTGTPTDEAVEAKPEITPVPRAGPTESRHDPTASYTVKTRDAKADTTQSASAVDHVATENDDMSQSTTGVQPSNVNDAPASTVEADEVTVRTTAPASAASEANVVIATSEPKARNETNKGATAPLMKEETTTAPNEKTGSTAEVVEAKAVEITPVSGAGTERDGHDAAYTTKAMDAKVTTTPSASAVETAAVGDDGVSQQITGAQPVEANDAPPSTAKADQVTTHKTAPESAASATNVATATPKSTAGLKTYEARTTAASNDNLSGSTAGAKQGKRGSKCKEAMISGHCWSYLAIACVSLLGSVAIVIVITVGGVVMIIIYNSK